jgi:hypothetical protein
MILRKDKKTVNVNDNNLAFIAKLKASGFVEVVVVPDTITAVQLRLQLLTDGHTADQVNAVINALPDPQKAQAEILWEYSTEVHRDNPLLQQLAVAVGYATPEAMDQFFISASKL